MKKTLNNVISYIENSVDSYLKVGLALVLVGGGYFLSKSFLANRPNITSATVMITNVEGNSGGSGVVIDSNNGESKILTNRHVCEVANAGGKVIATSGETHLVKFMQKSSVHDMCLITVSGNFKIKSTVASEAPTLYTEATISGHPNLLPNVVTKGHFSGVQIIQVMTGFKQCTAEDINDAKLGLICAFFGGLPVIKTYEAMLATAMIMPGSSGSAVYNSDKELSGLVFAGSGNMSYAYIVPYEYVRNFLINEVSTIPVESPNYEMDIKKELEKQRQQNREILKKCQNNTNIIVEEYCDLVVKDIIWKNH